MGVPSTLSRRRLVAGFGAVGCTALAGCAAPGSSAADRSYDRSVLRATVDIGTPTVPSRVPVDIPEAALRDARDRAESLLATATDRLPELPAGEMREYANGQVAATRADLAEADGAETPYEALGTLSRARRRAANARAAVLAALDELDAGSVLAERAPIRDRATAFESRWAYRGDPPHEAVVVYQHVESTVPIATRALDRAVEATEEERPEPVVVGEAAELLEWARARLDTGELLYDRHRAATDDRQLRSTFSEALAALAGDLRHRFDRIPTGYRDGAADYLRGDLDGTAVEGALERAYGDARSQVAIAASEAGDEGPATRLVRATMADRSLRAFEQLRTAAERGEFDRLRSAAQVRRAKLDLLRGVSAARDGRHPALTAEPLASPVATAATHDRRLRDALDAERDIDVQRVYRDLTLAAAEADAVPVAVDTVVGAVSAADG